MELRPDQLRAVQQLRDAFRAGYRRPTLVAPTGYGKTHTAAYIIREAIAKGKRVWFLAHLHELLIATSRKLIAEGIEHGFIMAGRPVTDERVQIVSVQTAVRRPIRYKPDLILVDEAHLAVAQTYQKVFEAAGNPRQINLTATPTRLDGRGLHEISDVLIQTTTTGELIHAGYLSPFRYFAPSTPNFSGARITGGDFNSADTANIVNKPHITGCAIREYLRVAKDRRAIVFCVGIEHAEEVSARAREHGIRAVAISGNSGRDLRDTALEELRSGALDWVVNCQLWVAGVDVPEVSCIIMLAPTMSVTKYLQSVGRGLRTSEGKEDCIILDHVGNADRLGLPDDPRVWTLDAKEKRTRSADTGPAVRQCKICFACMPVSRRECRECGSILEPTPREIEQRDGELQEVQRRQEQTERKQAERQARTLEDWQAIGRARNYSPQWAAIRYKLRSKRA